MRNKLVLDFWDRSRDLNINNKKYKSYVQNFFKDKLKQDTGKGDITSDSLISKNKNIKASVIARENGIISGIEEVSLLIKEFKVKKYKKDGEKVKNNVEATLMNMQQKLSEVFEMPKVLVGVLLDYFLKII